MRKKVSTTKEIITETIKEEKVKEVKEVNVGDNEERILFVISSITSMGQCPSSWHDYTECIGDDAWRFMPSPFADTRKDILTNAVTISKLSMGCIFLCDLFSSLHQKSKEKVLGFAVTTLSDRIDRPVDGSFGGSFASYRMLSTRLTCLAKQKILNIPTCNFDAVHDLLGRQNEKVDKIVFILDTNSVADEASRLSFKNLLTRVRCHIILLSQSNDKLSELRSMVESSPLNSSISICKKPQQLISLVFHLTDLILDKKMQPMKGISFKFGSKAPMRVKLVPVTHHRKESMSTEIVAKKVKKEVVSVPRKITSWTLKKRSIKKRWKMSGAITAYSAKSRVESIEIVGFLAVGVGEKYIYGAGMNDLFVLQNAYSNEDGKDDDSRKLMLYTDSFMTVLIQSFLKTCCVAFCQIRRYSLPPRYCFVFCVSNGVLANEECKLPDCRLVLGLLSKSRHPETWSHLLSYVSGAEVKATPMNHRSRLISHPNWINGEYLSRDTIMKLAKLIKKNNVQDVQEDLNRMYTHAKLICMGFGWLLDVIKALLDSARSQEMRNMLSNYSAEMRKFTKT